MRYRYRTSTDTEDALPADGRWDAKARLRGDFIESQFEEHQVEQSVKNLLPEHVPGTMLEDLELSADWRPLEQRGTFHLETDTC